MGGALLLNHPILLLFFSVQSILKQDKNILFYKNCHYK